LTWFVLSYFIGIFGFPVIGGWLLVDLGRNAFLGALLAAALSEWAILYSGRATASDGVRTNSTTA
ncbi:MFS transporter, partial [Escherichia coli]|nr:MFS transporter [Escherichia coli]